MLYNDFCIGCAGRPGGFNILFLTDCQHGSPYDTCICGNRGYTNRYHQVHESCSQGSYNGNCQQCLGHSQKHIHKTHDQIIHPSAVVTCDCPQNAAYNYSNANRDKANQKGHSGPVHNTAEDVAAELICSENVAWTGVLKGISQILLGKIIGRDNMCEYTCK